MTFVEKKCPIKLKKLKELNVAAQANVCRVCMSTIFVSGSIFVQVKEVIQHTPDMHDCFEFSLNGTITDVFEMLTKTREEWFLKKPHN